MEIKYNKLVYYAIVSVIIIIYSSCYVYCATYYVATSGSDGNTGSVSLPWRSIQKAANTIVAGDTVYVQAGSYSENIYTTSNGTNGNYITFQAQGDVSITKFQIRHNYIKIDGFTFSTSIPSDNMAIEISGTSNLIISNNKFIQSGSNDYYAVRCSYYSGSSNILITQNYVTNWLGIAFDLHGSNITASYNTIDGFSNDTFRTEALFNSRIANNIVKNGKEIGRHTDFFQVFGDNGYDSYNIIVENNVVRDSTIQICMTTNDGKDIRDYTIRNNIFMNVGLAAQLTLVGMKVYNNLFWNSGQNTSAVLHFDSRYLSNVEVKNNIFIGCGDGSNSNPAYDVPASSISADYNFAAKMPTNSWATVPYFSEMHGINGGNPNFVDYVNYNFQLASNSNLIDKGTTVSGWASATDINGVSRPQGAAWDIGPYEYNSNTKSIVAPPTNLNLKQ